MSGSVYTVVSGDTFTKNSSCYLNFIISTGTVDRWFCSFVSSHYPMDVLTIWLFDYLVIWLFDYLVRHFPALHFPVSAIWSVIFRSCIFHSCIFRTPFKMVPVPDIYYQLLTVTFTDLDFADDVSLWRMMSTYGATQSWVACQKRRRRRWQSSSLVAPRRFLSYTRRRRARYIERFSAMCDLVPEFVSEHIMADFERRPLLLFMKYSAISQSPVAGFTTHRLHWSA